MKQRQKSHEISVTWRGKKYVLEMTSSATLRELGNSLQKLTDVKADTLRLIVRSNKSSKLLSPFSDEHSCLKLQETSIFEEKSIMMMGVPKYEVDQVLLHAKTDMRIAGFDEEEKRLRQRMISGPRTALKLPQGNYVFCEFRTLHIPGIELNPPASEALKLMHMLAADPGIVAVMNKHRWRVGIMTEMAPEGYVGVSPVCILGFNKNQGEEISLRLRTDDLKGFRKYQSIKKTLLHELAHMIYSEHDANFYALDKQLNQEADSLDWTRSRSQTLSGVGISQYHEEEFYASNSSSSSQTLGGKGTDQLANARASSVAAAFRRLGSALSNVPGPSEAHEEPDPDDFGLDTHQGPDCVHTVGNELNMTEVNKVHCEPNNEPDPDDSNINKNKFEPDPDDSRDGEIMESEPYNETSEGRNFSEPDPDDSGMTEWVPPSKADLVLAKTLVHGEPDPDDLDSHTHLIGNFVEPDPDDSQNGVMMAESVPDDSVKLHQGTFRTQTDEPDPDDQELRRIQDPVTVVCSRLKKAIEMLQSELNPSEAVIILQTLFKIIRYTSNIEQRLLQIPICLCLIHGNSSIGSRNVIEHPDEVKFRKLRKANPIIQRNVASHKAALEILLLIGFSEDTVLNEIGKAETYLILKRNDPGLLWLAKSSLETCIA